jgi:tRNA (uracil-5-)-methyltransferase
MSDLYQPGVNPERYTELLEQKCQRLTALMAAFTPPALEVHASATSHFRLRAEFRLWHQAERCFYAMFEPGDRSKVYEVQDFPIASKLINQLMQQLLEQLHQSDILRNRLFQVEFLTTLSGDALITLVYHKALNDHWQTAARELMATLGFPVIGRSRKQKIVLERDYVNECLRVDNLSLHYRQIEGGFTQPNGGMNQQMLSWSRQCLGGLGGDLVELYCGNGNFSVALANCFERVLATEVAKTSVAAAQINIANNHIDNLKIVRLSSEEFVRALRGEQSFERLRDINLADYNFRTVLVDPPRAGLDDESVRQIQDYDNILYISCNPETLHANLQVLTTTHDIVNLALFDQFPYTDHIETGVFLQRRPATQE